MTHRTVAATATASAITADSIIAGNRSPTVAGTHPPPGCSLPSLGTFAAAAAAAGALPSLPTPVQRHYSRVLT